MFANTPYVRLAAYLAQVRDNPSGRIRAVDERSKPPVYNLVLPRGDLVRVGMDSSARWFDLNVPDFGNVHVTNETNLVSPIHEHVDQFLRHNGL